MNAVPPASPRPPAPPGVDLAARFARLRDASRADPVPTFPERRDRLERLAALLAEGRAAVEAAISADFGHRAVQETRLAEAFVVEADIAHALRRLKRWMRPKRVSTGLAFLPGRNRLLPRPLGVVGIVAPWNYPLQLTLAPLVGAFAAGNRAMVKPSELAPRFSALLADLVARRYGPDELAVVEGGPDVAAAFVALPFDHLLFTGSTRVGRLVAEAAAKSLTPVTLELGGKSPAILDASADVAVAADRIAYGKLLNAGQTCIAPDHVLLAPDQEEAFVAAWRTAVRRRFGHTPDDPAYTAIVSPAHRRRQQELVDDALAQGARVVWSVADPGRWDASPKFPPCLLLDTTPAMRARREEIFGPVLPVVTVADADAAIAHVLADERPLALYWFGRDRAALERVTTATLAGGVTVDECLLHIAQVDQPFGGVGASGIGAYHGEWGFRTFSKLMPIYERPAISGLDLVRPPYGRTFDLVTALLRRIL